MQLTEEDIREFGAIWKRAFNEDIPLAEARHRASQILELYAALAKPLPSERRSYSPSTDDTP